MTFFETIQAAGLPIISVNADGSDPVFTRALTDEELAQYTELKLQYFDPAAYAELLQKRADYQKIKDEYINMINRLEQIQAAVNPTNAQVVQAIKDEALYIERIMKFIKRLLV